MSLDNLRISLLVALLCACHNTQARRGGAFQNVEDLDDAEPSAKVNLRSDDLKKLETAAPTTTAVPPTTASADDGTNVTKTLIFTQVIFRHGDKFKEEGEYFNKDPYKIEDPFWLPFGLGQLRNMGKQRVYWLGQFLRMRYNGFLKEEYFYRHVRMVSADTDKNLMSAQLVLLGLYPPRGTNIWNDNVGRVFQPIPVHGIQADLDYTLNQILCPPYIAELKKVFTTDCADVNAKNKELFTEISKSSGSNITHLGELFQIYNIMRIEFENGRILPEWMKAIYPSKVKALALTTYDYFVKTEFMKLIRSGPLITQILTDMEQKLNKTLDPDYKMTLYSTSDITLLSLLKTLGADENLDPEYGATIMIELHNLEGKLFVKVQYMDNGFKRYCKPLKFKGYGDTSTTLIPYEKFVSVNAKYKILEEEWYAKCGIPFC